MSLYPLLSASRWYDHANPPEKHMQVTVSRSGLLGRFSIISPAQSPGCRQSSTHRCRLPTKLQHHRRVKWCNTAADPPTSPPGANVNEVGEAEYLGNVSFSHIFIFVREFTERSFIHDGSTKTSKLTQTLVPQRKRRDGSASALKRSRF